ncbi:hypothetical protein ACOSP7_015756 [Xanthoceras sorbifolium]
MSKLLVGPKPSPPIIVLIEICRSQNELKQIHAHTITNGLSHFSYITSKLLAFSALSPHGSFHHAETIFNRIPKPNVFDFNSMLMGFIQNSQPEKGLLLFSKMRRLGVEPNARTFTALVQSCVSLSLLDQIYGLVIRFGLTSDVYVTSSVISMYSRYKSVDLACRVFDESLSKNVVCWTSLITGYCSNGLVVEARDLFDSMPERNDVSCSAMISGYVKNDCFNEAVELFSELKSCDNLKLNASLLVSVLNACAAIGAFKEGKWIHDYVDENGFEYDLELGTTLIDFYAKCGCIEDACEVFGKMPCKDVMTWSAMILGLAMNGMNDKGLELFMKMERRGLRPNAVTFVGALTACNHKSLVNEASRLFGRMSKVYGIYPTIEHYGCMVDLLARAGLVKEAEILIKSMPMEPDGAIWGSLLNGCLMHDHIELGKRVGRLVIDLEPRHSGRYVLLSNIYATMGCWEDVIRLRKLMKEREVNTVSAWSFIEIDGWVHKFLVNDQSHCHWRGIYRVLNLLRKELEGLSIVNDILLR